jgi:uncharacterized protein (TIGR00369 family)
VGEITITWEDPARLAARSRGMTGIEFLRAIRDGELPPAPIQALMSFRLDEVDEGRVVFVAQPGPEHYNPIGVVHAGLAATILDSAMAASVHSTLEQGEGYTTLETNFHLVRAVTADDGEVRAEGQVVHRGGRVATAEARATRADGKLVAHGTSTCMILS